MTAEERFKERFSEVYWETKEECEIQRFHYYDMVDFCQQSIDAELDLANKKIEKLMRITEMWEHADNRTDLPVSILNDKEMKELADIWEIFKPNH